MKLINYTTKQAAQQADESRLAAYKLHNKNVNALVFSEIIEHEEKFYLPFVEDLSEYYSTEEINSVQEIEIN